MAPTPPPDEQDAATARLEASNETLPPFDVVLLGPYAIAERDAGLKRLAVLNEIPPSRAAAHKKEPKP